VLGDSTFFHTGLPALLNVVYNKGNTLTIILDNRTTAMTGHQENPGTGLTLDGQETLRVDFEKLCKAMGIEHTYKVDPYDLEALENVLRLCLDVDAPAVLIAERACALLPEVRRTWQALEVDPERCNGCGLCLKLGCPAMTISDLLDEKSGRPLAEINPLLCTGCEICAQVCARKGISFREYVDAKVEAA
jgi:indolepyruvate ferredoxin oxidoreductase, alpha subunit